VVDPIKAVVNVQNYMFAVSQQAQTSLRQIIGQSEMDQLLAERDEVNRELRRVIDEPTEGPWGIRVERVEIKDVSLPESMKRSMSRQAEAERERRARIITAGGEYQASKRLAAAASMMAAIPPPCSCGCRPWSRSPRSATAPWSCPSRWSCSGSSRNGAHGPGAGLSPSLAELLAAVEGYCGRRALLYFGGAVRQGVRQWL
jgi:hypothetical protein